MSTRQIAPHGKPMRALKVLAASDPANPLTEYDVYRSDTPKGVTDHGTYYWALKTLVERGLAKRTGRHGGYQWFITDAGRALLASRS